MTAASAAGLDLLQSLDRLIAEKFSPLKEVLEQVSCRVSDVEHVLEEKASAQLIAGELRPLSEFVEQVSARVSEVEHALKEKADAQIYMRIEGVEQMLLEKASASNMKLVTDQIAGLEQALKGKADMSIHTHVAQVEQAMRGKANRPEMHELVQRSVDLEEALKTKADISAHAKLESIERGLTEKANHGNLQQLHGQVAALERTLAEEAHLKVDLDVQGKITSIEQTLHDLAGSDGELGIRVGTLQAQLAATESRVKDGLHCIENMLNEKVDLDLRRKITSIEQTLRDVAGAAGEFGIHVSNVQAQLFATESRVKDGLKCIENRLNEKAGQPQMLRLEETVAELLHTMARRKSQRFYSISSSSRQEVHSLHHVQSVDILSQTL